MLSRYGSGGSDAYLSAICGRPQEGAPACCPAAYDDLDDTVLDSPPGMSDHGKYC
jgi:hypothetical protein